MCAYFNDVQSLCPASAHSKTNRGVKDQPRRSTPGLRCHNRSLKSKSQAAKGFVEDGVDVELVAMKAGRDVAWDVFVGFDFHRLAVSGSTCSRASSAPYAAAARMAGREIDGYCATISSGVIPSERQSSTTLAGMRVPAIHA